MNKLGTYLYTLFCGVCVGQDQFGNKYYQSKSKSRALNRNHRWVYFNGDPEASKIPSGWFSWIHYQTDECPQSNELKYSWQKQHEVNLTGTSAAYYPKGHILSDGKRSKATGDYEAWNEEK